MAQRSRRRERDLPPGAVSEGGVDDTTGALTGAAAGAALGAAAGPIGFTAGALIGAALGAIAADGRENPYYPEPWLTRREQLHPHRRELDE